jgi:hypothetical protein
MEHCYLPGMLMKFSLVRIMSLLICLALLASGCATSLPPVQYDTPFATIEISLVRGAFGFFGTAAFVTKDAVWVVIPEEKHLIKIDPLQTKLVAGTPIGANSTRMSSTATYRQKAETLSGLPQRIPFLGSTPRAGRLSHESPLVRGSLSFCPRQTVQSGLEL